MMQAFEQSGYGMAANKNARQEAPKGYGILFAWLRNANEVGDAVAAHFEAKSPISVPFNDPLRYSGEIAESAPTQR